jgi:glycosyltransferase involved in cell wall biosynthesis
MKDHRVKFLTVLLPTHNLGKYLKCAIDSILNQTYKEYELLIIDDGSTDNTADIVQTFKDSRINYLYKKHSGLADSMNYGLNVAQADWIAVMEADDIAIPLRFEKEIEFLNNNYDYSVISCWYAVFKNNSISYIVQNPISHYSIYKCLSLHSPICNQGVIYNKHKILEKGGYDLSKREYDLWLRIKDSVKFYNFPETLMLVRFRNNSLTHFSMQEHKRIVYASQIPFYERGLDKEFGISSKNEQNEINAWREWFYGEVTKARKIWLKTPSLLLKPKVSLAFLLSFLPNRLLVRIQLLNLKYKILYLFVDKEIKSSIKKKLTISCNHPFF